MREESRKIFNLGTILALRTIGIDRCLEILFKVAIVTYFIKPLIKNRPLFFPGEICKIEKSQKQEKLWMDKNRKD